MSEPDLFVVCKNCSAEVSPYVTECPYCGQRVRKRAPKIGPGRHSADRAGCGGGPQAAEAAAGRDPRDRAGDDAARHAAADRALAARDDRDREQRGRPTTTWARCSSRSTATGGGVAATPFLHDNLGYAFIALTATGIFGMHLERRFGLLTPMLIFVAAGAAGAALSDAADVLPAVGANGAALGLLCAWLVEDRAAARRGDDRENDLLGVYVIAGLLLALSLATEDASIVAALGGAATGALAGLLLTAVRR